MPALVLLLGAGLASDLSASFFQTSLLLHLFRSSESPSLLGGVTLAASLPMLAATAGARAWARRHDRMHLITSLQAVRVPVTLLALLLASRGVAWLLLCQALVGALSAVHNPTRQSLVSAVVPASRRPLANSAMATATILPAVLGPAACALVFARYGFETPVAVSAVLCAAAVLAASPLRRCLASRDGEDMPAPLRLTPFHASRSTSIRCLLLLSLVGGTAGAMVGPLLRPFVADALLGDDGTYAQLHVAFGAGALLGPVLAPWALARFSAGRLLATGFLVEGALMLVWTQQHVLLCSLGVFFLWGVVIFALLPCQATYVQGVAGAHSLDVFIALDQATYAAQIAAGVIVIVAGDASAPGTLLTAAAAAYLVAVVALLSGRGGRALRLQDPATVSPR